jgi:hypothetical protein
MDEHNGVIGDQEPDGEGNEGKPHLLYDPHNQPSTSQLLSLIIRMLVDKLIGKIKDVIQILSLIKKSSQLLNSKDYIILLVEAKKKKTNMLELKQ